MAYCRLEELKASLKDSASLRLIEKMLYFGLKPKGESNLVFMKQILLLIVGVCMLVGLQGQSSLTIEPAMVKKQVMADLSDLSYEEVIKVVVSNPTNQTLELRWDKVVAYQPSNWESQVCDKVASYPPQVVTNFDPLQGMKAPIVLTPGETFDLYLTILI